LKKSTNFDKYLVCSVKRLEILSYFCGLLRIYELYNEETWIVNRQILYLSTPMPLIIKWVIDKNCNEKQQQIKMPAFVSVSEEILDDWSGCNTQKKSIGNKYNIFLEDHKHLTKSSNFIWNYLVASSFFWWFHYICVAFSEYMNFKK